MSKLMYIISGSEDGNLGVSTNKKSAWEGAMRYLSECEKSTLTIYNYEIMKEIPATYSNLCKALKNHTLAEVRGTTPWGDLNVDISGFYTNNYY